MTSDGNDWGAPLAADPWQTPAATGTATEAEPWPSLPVEEVHPALGDADDVLRLPPVPRADDTLRALRDRPPGAPIRLEASAVTRLGMPMIQLVLAASRDADAAGDRLVVIAPSFAFTLAFEAFGFGPDNEPYAVEYA